MFPKERLIDILKNFILFSEDAKILAGYHQYFAVNKALESVHEAIGGDGKGGVFWHTQARASRFRWFSLPICSKRNSTAPPSW